MKAFLHRLQQAVARARRHERVKSAFLLFSLEESADLDTIVENFTPLTRCEDTLLTLPDSRIGVILEDMYHISDPMRVADRLQRSAADFVKGVAVVVSLGLYETSQDVFEEALKTLSDRPGVKVQYTNQQLGTESESRLKLEAELAETVEVGKLVTYYQPIFNLTHGMLTGFEALVRWEHPQHGLLLPGAFLEIAERRGHLLKIDEAVLKHALTQIAIWNQDSDRPIYVSVNLASGHFLNAERLHELIRTLNTHPSSLNLLRIDVDEKVLFDQEGIDSLKTLDMLRIGFNLDDFGVDSESFHCLGSFPFNSLKIDRTLINQMEDEVNAELIVAVLRIAKRMGMKTIAEGVVTHAQLEELRNLGCTEAQGFLFSKAVCVQEATELISDEYRW
jgi:EAL domain-containing protein (putative c-di-GMP-specific phosphodiesterase class I)